MIAMKGLSWEEHATGVIFGFLRQIQQLAEEFPNSRFAFAWDSRRSFRRNVYPIYKEKPEMEDPEMIDLLNSGKPQFSTIRFDILPRLGFNNNFMQRGLEADDIIACITRDHAQNMDHTYIVSSDEDLFQLLRKNVSIYNPREKKVYTEEDFKRDKGIFPTDWPYVKAVAGCNSDNVKGIKGVGEKTVLKVLTGGITHGKKFQEIINYNPDFNLDLVKLPHAKTRPVTLVWDNLNMDEFEPLCLDFGFSSFLRKETYNKWKNILKNPNPIE